MGKIVGFVKTMAFWGTFFLIMLLFGFKVSVNGLVSDLFSGIVPVDIYSGILLVSPIIFFMFLVIGLITSRNNGLSRLDKFVIAFLPLVWTPYKGLDIREIFKFKKLGMDKFSIVYDLRIFFIRLIETIVWWFAVAYGAYTVVTNSTCEVAVALQKYQMQQILIRAAITVGVIIALNLIAWIMYKTMINIWRKNSAREQKSNKGTAGQRYFARHPERIPSGCRGCGGPYPECRSSCNLFGE